MTASEQSHDAPPDSAWKRSSESCMKLTSAECTVENSWWWAERMPETCRVLWQNKFGIIISSGWLFKKKSVTMHGNMNVHKKSHPSSAEVTDGKCTSIPSTRLHAVYTDNYTSAISHSVYRIRYRTTNCLTAGTSAHCSSLCKNYPYEGPGIKPRTIHARHVVDKVAVQQVFLRVLRLSLVSVNPRMPDAH